MAVLGLGYAKIASCLSRRCPLSCAPVVGSCRRWGLNKSYIFFCICGSLYFQNWKNLHGSPRTGLVPSIDLPFLDYSQPISQSEVGEEWIVVMGISSGRAHALHWAGCTESCFCSYRRAAGQGREGVASFSQGSSADVQLTVPCVLQRQVVERSVRSSVKRPYSKSRSLDSHEGLARRRKSQAEQALETDRQISFVKP